MEDKIQSDMYPDLSGAIPWTPEEAEYLQTHIQSFTSIQCGTIQNSFAYKDISLSKFDWNAHIHQAYSWCSAFRVPCNLQVSTNLYKSFGYKN